MALELRGKGEQANVGLLLKVAQYDVVCGVQGTVSMAAQQHISLHAPLLCQKGGVHAGPCQPLLALTRLSYCSICSSRLVLLLWLCCMSCRCII